jgi:5'-methylthioadenosine phosphorylase
MEGPAFSTVAESNLYRSWGMDIIGMTNLQEAKLAREAEICYSTIALVTDYDCWHPDHDAVTVQQIIAYLNQNSQNAQELIRSAVRTLDSTRSCACGSALKTALLTDPQAIPAAAKEKLKILIGKYIA